MIKISIVTPTFNEEENIKKLCTDIKAEMEKLNIDYEHIVIDNSSTDKTIDILKEICLNDNHLHHDRQPTSNGKLRPSPAQGQALEPA